MALLQVLRFADQPVGPGVLGERLELGETVLDRLELGGDRRREFGSLRADMRVFGGEAVIGVEHRPDPRPVRAQFLGLLFELFDRQPPDECRVVEKAVLVAAEEVARDRAAGAPRRPRCRQTRRAASRAGTAPSVNSRRTV